jgi:hypothetical protein
MESDDRYIKASRYDLKTQAHNSRVFHRELVGATVARFRAGD